MQPDQPNRYQRLAYPPPCSVTAVDNHPGDDQAGARSRDLARLIELIGPHLPANHTGPVTDAFPFMTPADCAEVEAIMDRLSDIGEDPERARERQKILLHYALLEAEAIDMVKRGQPRFRNGKILRDPQTGEPLRNRNIDRRARTLLRNIRRSRAQMTGIPAPEDEDEPR
jgi:hypothetical protein